MTNHRTAVTIFHAKRESERVSMPVIWSDQWRTFSKASGLMKSVDGLWNHAGRHHQQGMDRAVGKPRDWSSRLGLRDELQDVSAMLRTVGNAQYLANELEAEIQDERASLRPYRTDTVDNASFAINRTSVRAAFLAMPLEAKHAFLRSPQDELTRRSLFELGRPELLGLAADDATYTNARDNAMTEVNGPALKRLESMQDLVTYARTLAVGVKRAGEAEAFDAGVTLDQLPAALKAVASVRVYSDQ